MKHSRSADRQAPGVDPYLDETMAMVYVGDVYSLVVQQGAVTEPVRGETKDKAKEAAPQDGRDALWPFVR